MQIRNAKDLASGLLFMGLGGAFAWGAGAYDMGSSASMGPGYFPRLLGWLLTALGAVLALRAVRWRGSRGGGVPLGPWAWRPLFFIIAANLAFGALLGGLPALGWPALGLMAGIYALVLLAGLAGERFRWSESLLLATALAAGSYVAFVWLLKLQLAVWPWS